MNDSSRKVNDWWWRLTNNFSIGYLVCLPALLLTMVIGCTKVISQGWMLGLMCVEVFAGCLVDWRTAQKLYYHYQLMHDVSQRAAKLRLSDEQVTILIKFYAYAEAVLTGTKNRLFDLEPYQIPGRLIDLQYLFQRIGLNVFYNQINGLFEHWSFKDEMVFKIYYGRKIKSQASHLLSKFDKFDLKYDREHYLEYLKGKYGDNCLTIAVWVIDQLRGDVGFDEAFGNLEVFGKIKDN